MTQGIGDEARLPLGAQARPDLTREARRGIPEVILAEPKTAEQVIAIARQFLDGVGRALISRISPEMAAAVTAALPDAAARFDEIARTLCLTVSLFTPVVTDGHVGIITAGTADLPVAAEARFIAEAMGCRVTMVCDVGVAGVHRLFRPLDELLAAGVDAIVVAAGMDGALPSLISGLVPCPVVGLPTPVGYGMGGQGEGALLSMLQSCSPGLAVVNIGNGIGAGSYAGLIANRIADARRDQTHLTAPGGHV